MTIAETSIYLVLLGIAFLCFVTGIFLIAIGFKKLWRQKNR